MKKIGILTVLFVLVVSLVGCDLLGNDDSVDRILKDEITIGNHYDYSIEKNGAKVLEFTLSATTEVYIYTESDFDTLATLVDSNNQVVALGDDRLEDFNFQIRTTLSAGVYTLSITGYDSTNYGDFTLYFEELVEAVYPVLEDGDVINGTLISDGIDGYEFTVDSFIEVTITSSSNIDLYGVIVDMAGSVIMDGDDLSAEVFDFGITTVLIPGTYYLAITGYDENEFGDYSISFSLQEPKAATELQPTSSAIGTLTQGDYMLYTFTLTASQDVFIYTTGTLDTFAVLLDNNHEFLFSADDLSDSDYNFGIDRSLEAGTYYLLVTGYDSSVIGGYTIYFD